MNRNPEVAAALARLLAESYTLYLKTHNFHWNVTGPHFHALHTMFEEQYTELATAVDEIAERIRALGHRAPGSYAEFARLSQVKDAEGEPDAQAMLAELAADHKLCAEQSDRVLRVAQEHNDEGTASLAGGRIELHEKTVWMLTAHLG
ncbi:Dps family protein [Alcanivorax quisquiliarum]|uniref:DNA starvation/stationary phase protection protein n=1 Tax=Alcanivorax quisquiliarum TaxID=2933565 RepID=A0ABT0E4K5_9GAMM|nr:DNA starvation/stationary phase protection protein [Alcanivorax quisquiliarum]MCK0536732.1 DNA starvation/stationary phase protection protein [Alcanivorax quisquiliarum]